MYANEKDMTVPSPYPTEMFGENTSYRYAGTFSSMNLAVTQTRTPTDVPKKILATRMTIKFYSIVEIHAIIPITLAKSKANLLPLLMRIPLTYEPIISPITTVAPIIP